MDKEAVFTGEADLGCPEPRENSLYFSLLTGIQLETSSLKTASTAISSISDTILQFLIVKSPQFAAKSAIRPRRLLVGREGS
jgi:hypothetical protein